LHDVKEEGIVIDGSEGNTVRLRYLSVEVAEVQGGKTVIAH
jgi:hypothetical protein